ncbi:hypothetical protein [Paucibacter sp. KBW04]|nr:hypothetical protein [Paucibacter sp. KBW04]
MKKKPVVLENKAWQIARLGVTEHEIAAAPGQYASTLKEQRVDPK